MTEKKNEKLPTSKLPTQLTLTVRALVGGYLLYTDYQLIGSLTNPDNTPQNKVFFGVAMFVFLVVGVFLLGLSAKYYKEGRYQGGAMDAGEDDENISSSIDAEQKSETLEVVDENDSNN